MLSQLLSLLILSLVLSTTALAAAPTRSFTYSTGDTINPTEVTTNEDNIFSYLQTGVDTYAVGSVNSAAILDGSITTTDILNGTITITDISGNTLTVANIVEVTRAEATASASASYTGMGFEPNVLIALCAADTTADNPSIGFCDDDVDEQAIRRDSGASGWVDSAIIGGADDGTNSQTATCSTFDADGFALTWTKQGSGIAVTCQILGIR